MVNIDKHGLFSVESLGMLRKWLVTLPLALAYQCDALLWNCLLNPQELLALRPRIQQLTTDQATQTLKHFGTVLYKHINEPGLSCEKLFDTACHEINLALAKVYRRKKEQWDHFCAEASIIALRFKSSILFMMPRCLDCVYPNVNAPFRP
jgi:hypothetical protein